MNNSDILKLINGNLIEIKSSLKNMSNISFGNNSLGQNTGDGVGIQNIFYQNKEFYIKDNFEWKFQLKSKDLSAFLLFVNITIVCFTIYYLLIYIYSGYDINIVNSYTTTEKGVYAITLILFTFSIMLIGIIMYKSLKIVAKYLTIFLEFIVYIIDKTLCLNWLVSNYFIVVNNTHIKKGKYIFKFENIRSIYPTSDGVIIFNQRFSEPLSFNFVNKDSIYCMQEAFKSFEYNK